MKHHIRAIFLDCGDTLVDEATEQKNAAGVSLGADLIAGADTLVQRLKQRGYRLALVADGYAESFIHNLRPHGIYDLFDAYAISEQVGVEKPNPIMFNNALHKLAIDPSEYGKVVMMGNNLERDIKGANQMGLISVWLNWSPRRSKIPADLSEVPQYTIQLPLDLLDVIDRIEQGFATNSQAK